MKEIHITDKTGKDSQLAVGQMLNTIIIEYQNNKSKILKSDNAITGIRGYA